MLLALLLLLLALRLLLLLLLLLRLLLLLLLTLSSSHRRLLRRPALAARSLAGALACALRLDGHDARPRSSLVGQVHRHPRCRC